MTCLLKAITMLISLCFISGCASAAPDDGSSCALCADDSCMYIYFFGIGRADAIVITTDSYTLMIDTGENKHGRYIVDTLRRRGITAIDYLIITHFDSDHVGGAHTIINNLRIGKVIVPNYSRASDHVRRFENAMRAKRLTPYVLTETMRLTLDGIDFIIDPSGLPYYSFDEIEDDTDDEASGTGFTPTGDDFSIVVRVTHGINNFLFTGDAVANRLGELLENDEIINVDYAFLKVPRHGRRNSRSREFINAISPRYAVITGFCPTLYDRYYPERPADERVIAALADVGAEIFFTMSEGLHIHSDGSALVITR